jgi:hypothetical protein
MQDTETREKEEGFSTEEVRTASLTKQIYKLAQFFNGCAFHFSVKN